MRTTLLTLTAALLIPLALPSCGGGSDGPESRKVAFVSNGVALFWNVCAAGALEEAEARGIECEIVFPGDTAQDQRQKLEDLLIRGVDGIAVSPVDASGMNDVLNKIARQIPLITQDSDAPDSERRCFIGVDNYAAGRTVGKLVKEALPDGGQIAIFIGRLEQQNARERRQGVIDELLDREDDKTRFDEVGSVPRGGKYEVIDTRVDNFALDQAKANAEDVLTANEGLDGMVGLFAYNPPLCLEALRGAGKLGKVVVVGFDEDIGTLDGIAAGHVFGTVSQNPYEYGRESVRVLDALIDGDESVIPPSGVITIEAEVVRQANLAEFRKKLEERGKSGAR